MHALTINLEDENTLDDPVVDAVVTSKFTRLICAGIYVGMTVDPKIDWTKVAEGLASTNFNAISLHLISPWNNVGFYPWVFDSSVNKFDLTKKNDAWFEKLEEGLTALLSNGISPLLKFFDCYQDAQWDKYGTNKSCKYKPFRQNTFGKVLLAQSLYDSWSAAAGGRVNFAWLGWEAPEKWIPSVYALVPPFGQPIANNYVLPVMDICKKLRPQFPDIPICYAYANECMSTTDGNGNWVHGGKNIGAGPEVQSWFHKQWDAAGFKRYLNPWTVTGKLKNFIEFYNMDSMCGGKPDPKASAKGAASDWQILKTMCHEVHSCDDPPMKDNDIPAGDFIKAGCNPKRFLFSRDGTDETLPQASENARILYKSGNPLVDIKWLFPDGGTWSMKDMQHNFDLMLPLMKSVVA